MKSTLLVFLSLAIAGSLAPSAPAQDSGIRDTLRVVCGDWYISSAADTLFSVELWAWTDTILKGIYLPMEIRCDINSTNFPGWGPPRTGLNSYKYDGVDLYFFVSSVDSFFRVDKFVYNPAITAPFKFVRKSVLNPTLDPSAENWGFNGCLLQTSVYSVGDSVIPRRVSTKIGDLFIKVSLSQSEIMPIQFPFLVKPIEYPLFYPSSPSRNYFRYTPQGGTGWYAPVFVPDTVWITSVPPWDAEELLEEPRMVPETYELAQNYPNPFNPSTTIRFYIARPQHVSITVYDILGRKVADLFDRGMAAGWHEVTWDGTSSSGGKAAAGLYFYKMAAGAYTETRKMLLLK